MKPASIVMLAGAFLSATLMLTAIPVEAGPLDERMFVGTWKTTIGGEVTHITWNSDGTGEQTFPDYPDDDWTFDWKLEDGKYAVGDAATDDWYFYDYEFSSMYGKLTLDDGDGTPIELERDSSIFSDLCCSSCCCGGMILPVAALSLFGCIATVAKRRW